MAKLSFGLILGVLGLALLGFGLFVMGRNPSAPKTVPSSDEPQTPTAEEPVVPKAVGLIVSVSFGTNGADIYTTDVETKKRRKVFTDSDETLKIKTVSGVTSDGLWTLATLGEMSKESGSTLALLDLTGQGKKQILLSDFGASGAPVIDPQGVKIAYVIFSNAEADYGYSLFVMDTDGANRGRIVRAEGLVGNPSISLDGSRIAYTVETNSGTELAVSDISGKNAKTILTLSGETIYSVSWGKDLIAYATMPKKETSANEGEIWTIDSDGSGKTQVTKNDRHDTTPAFLKDGNYLAYVGIDFAGGKKTLQGEGDVYYEMVDGKGEIKLFSADQVLGWKK
jgi:Tol biopolymer transport system component